MELTVRGKRGGGGSGKKFSGQMLVSTSAWAHCHGFAFSLREWVGVGDPQISTARPVSEKIIFRLSKTCDQRE